MANFGQLVAGAGRVSQGMEQARGVRQANEARAQQLQEGRMRLEELRRMEEARARMSQLPSTVGDLSFDPTGGYQARPTYQAPAVAPQATPSPAGVTAPAVTMGVTAPTAGVKPTPPTATPPVATAPEPTTAAPAKGQMTREMFMGLSPEVQQQYLQREADIRGFASIPAFLADVFVGMPAEYAGRAAESFAESRLGRTLGLTAPGEEANYRGLTGGTASPFQESLRQATPTTLDAYIASLPSDAEVQGIPSDTDQPEIGEPAPEQPVVTGEAPPPPVAVGLDVGTKKDPIQSVAKGRPPMFEADPTQYTPYLEQGMRNRDYLRQVANIYRQSGFPDKAFEIEAKIQGLDTDLYKMATDQAINEFRRGGDPARMVGLLREFANVPVDVQYRTDGLYNVFVNDQMLEQPVDAAALTDELRTLVDTTYRDQKINAQLSNQKAILDAQLETDKEIMKQNAQMVREAAIAHINGQYNLTKEQMNQRGYTITNLNDGRVVITAKDGSTVGVVDLNNNVVEIDGQEIPVAPEVQPFQFQ